MGGGSYVNCQWRRQCCQLRRRLERGRLCLFIYLFTLLIHLFHLSCRITLN
jgi:hypothetical protein